jgi:hypothetical protein
MCNSDMFSNLKLGVYTQDITISTITTCVFPRGHVTMALSEYDYITLMLMYDVYDAFQKVCLFFRTYL